MIGEADRRALVLLSASMPLGLSAAVASAFSINSASIVSAGLAREEHGGRITLATEGLVLLVRNGLPTNYSEWALLHPSIATKFVQQGDAAK